MVIIATAMIAIAVHQHTLFARDLARAEVTLTKYELDERRPEYADLVELSHGLGRSAEYIANAAIADAATPVNLAGADRETRERWIRAMQNLKSELGDAQSLILDATEVRPGWARHLSMTGQLEYFLAKSGEPTELETWRTPLLLGARNEGGTRVAWFTLAGAYLEIWPYLPPEEHELGREAMTEAFHDPQFVRQAFPAAFAYLEDEAIALLPDDPEPLAVAMRLMPGQLGPERSWQLYERWREAERHARVADLETIRRYRRLGDHERADVEARRWLALHPFEQDDNPEGLGQLSEVVGAMVKGWAEPWGRGPQSRLVNFLLDPWRQQYVDMEGVWRVAERIQGAPEPVLARVRLAAGRDDSAMRLAESSVTAGSLEWTDFYVDLARHHLGRNDTRAAANALARISPVAGQQCEVLLTRLALAEATNNRAQAEALETDLRVVSLRGLASRARNGRATVPVCIAPGDTTPVPLTVSVAEPAVIDLGWDTGRTTSLLAEGDTHLALPPRPGSHLLMLTTPLTAPQAELKIEN